MNYSSIRPSYIIKQKILIDKKTIFIVLPDTNLDISTEIYGIRFLLSNLVGLVCPNKIMTIGKKKFNGKAHFYDVKKKLSSTELKVGKKIKVLNSLVIEKADKEILTSSSRKTSNYYLYDATVWSQALEYMLQRFSERAVVKQLFEELTTLYTQIKSNNPDYDVDVLFLIKNQGGRLFNIFTNIRSLIKSDELKSSNFFDNFSIISDCENVMIPIFNKEDLETKLITANLTKLEQFIEANSTVKDINKAKETAVADKVEDGSIISLNIKKDDETEINKTGGKIKQPSFLSDIVKTLQTSTLVASTNSKNEIEVKLNHAELKKALKSNKITDPDIITNVQIALNKYIEQTNTKPTQEQAEDIVLRAINYTISGSDVVPEEYLHKPHLLFNKLKQIDTYKVPLNITKRDDNIVDLNKIINLKYTTGQHRQKFEFETAIHENVKKLFNSLEMAGAEYPIKVKKIESSIEDDNIDRFINYKITLQNLNGGKKEPYSVELKVPSPVNEKYFKLHGYSYIMSNQQFLRPVTKTDKNEVRLISNYGIVRVGMANAKFNPTDLDTIFKYIQIRYPKLIKKVDENSCNFSDGSVIYFAGERVYKSDIKNINEDIESGRLQDESTKELLKQNKYEFLYDTILDKIHTVNPTDNLTKTKKALPYLWIYLGALKMPLILYLWSQKGLLAALNEFGINYEIVDTETKKDDSSYIAQADGKFLKITPENLKQKILVNGLTTIKLKDPINDFNDPQEIYDYISQTYGTRSIILIRLISENFVDPITKELLQFENMPTNLTELSSKVAVDQLLNKKIDSLSDLKIYRSRLSEIILNIVYKQIKLSHNFYRKRVIEGDDQAVIFLDPDYVINSLLTDAGVLQNAEPVCPITEIMLSSRVIKSGKGGVPSKRSFKKEHRNINPSQYGIMGACSTPEYVDVGLTTHHTLTPVIINKYGLRYGPFHQ